MPEYAVLRGPALDVLKDLPGPVNTSVTSPPYWRLRDYLHPQQLGQEDTAEEYIENLCLIFDQVHRITEPDGTLWVNIGDTYKNKQLTGIPWLLAFALKKRGWLLRSDVIWCISGGTMLYAKTDNGITALSARDVARRIEEGTNVHFWNGSQWTKVARFTKTKRSAHEIQFTLRSGEKISSTREHRWPTARGLVKTEELCVGDVLQACQLPEPDQPDIPPFIPDEFGWLVGVFLAEGNFKDGITLAGHEDETKYRLEKLKTILEGYGASATVEYGRGHSQVIYIGSSIVATIVRQYIHGHTSKDKYISPDCWRRSNKFLKELLEGYLHGDGHYDQANDRWRLGFTRNTALASSIRTICARLGYSLTLNQGFSNIGMDKYPSYRGEIRMSTSGYRTEKHKLEIVEIGKSKSRDFYDFEVEDEPHLFALASGVLTHNCKLGGVPETCKDRPSRNHEYLFLFAKSKHYFYDYEAVLEPHTNPWAIDCIKKAQESGQTERPRSNPFSKEERRRKGTKGITRAEYGVLMNPKGKNKRTVWSVKPAHDKRSHFAPYPEDLIKPCVIACCPVGGWVLDPFCGTGTTGKVSLASGRNFIGIELLDASADMAEETLRNVSLVVDKPAAVCEPAKNTGKMPIEQFEFKSLT